jgi:hypothetical protein
LATVGVLAGHDALKGSPEKGIAKSDTSQNRQATRQPQDSNHTAQNAMPEAPQTTTHACDEAGQQGRQNLEIQREMAIFTLLLVIVGALGVTVAGLQVGAMIWQARLLKQTRDDIHSQAEWMKAQTEILRDSVAAAQMTAEATLTQSEMVKSKERAQLSIEFDDVNPAIG